jgi:hypothetical protein
MPVGWLKPEEGTGAGAAPKISSKVGAGAAACIVFNMGTMLFELCGDDMPLL